MQVQDEKQSVPHLRPLLTTSRKDFINTSLPCHFAGHPHQMPKQRLIA